MPVLREAYPHLEGKYQRYYRGPYAPQDYTQQVIARVNELRAQYGMDHAHPASERRGSPRGQLQMAL